MNDDGGGPRRRSRGLNKIQIIGNLGRDPELRFTQDGTPVCNFSVAVSESWRTRDGEQRDHTEWFRVSAWRRLAEVANEYYRKGSRVYVEGTLRTNEWQDREGNNRTSLEITARDMINLTRRDEFDGPPSRDDFGGGERQDAGGGDRRDFRGQQPQGGRSDEGDTITEDDLPF